LRGVGHVP